MNNRIGEIEYNQFGSKMIIKEYRSYTDIDVYFPEYNWTAEHRSYDKFKSRKNIKCPYESRVFGRGYLGEGKYICKDYKIYYYLWEGMLERCYYPKFQEKCPSYIGCKVCEEWLNFQNFGEWCENNYYKVKNERMQLDKDILHKGNKIYSPDTCIFVPQRINGLFIKNNRNRGDSPIGVMPYYNKYKTQCNDTNGDVIHLGLFDNPHDAFLMYKINKELLIQCIANEYKDKIPQKLYDAMMNYEINEND